MPGHKKEAPIPELLVPLPHKGDAGAFVLFNLKYTSQARLRLKNSCNNNTFFFVKCVFVPFMEFFQPSAAAPTGKVTPRVLI